MIDNLLTVFYMLGLLAIVVVVNTILGVVIASQKVEFSWRTLFKGLGKALAIMLCVLLFCVTLEFIPIVLTRIGIEIPTDLITVIEIILTTLTAYKKYATDCVDKFKTILGVGTTSDNTTTETKEEK